MGIKFFLWEIHLHGCEYPVNSNYLVCGFTWMENTNITHKNPMHLNVKHQQWKYPINVICTTFPCVGFVSSIHGFLQNFPVIEGGDFEKNPPVRPFRTD